VNIVCDTNVLISGVLFGGHAREILQLASRGVLINFISPDILREAERVLGRSKFGLRPEHVLEIMALFKDTFEIVIPSLEVQAIRLTPKTITLSRPPWRRGQNSPSIKIGVPRMVILIQRSDYH